MFDTPFFVDSPILGAFVQTILLLLIPLAVASMLGGILGICVFFWRHPLFSHSANPHIFALRPLRYFRSFGYLAFLPLLIIQAHNVLGIDPGMASMIAITLGAVCFFVFHIYIGLNQLDSSVLEGALSTGLNRRWMIRRVLLPLAKYRLLHALLETTLFALAMGAVSGILTGYGLSGVVRMISSSSANLEICIVSYLILALLFILSADLSSRYATKTDE